MNIKNLPTVTGDDNVRLTDKVEEHVFNRASTHGNDAVTRIVASTYDSDYELNEIEIEINWSAIARVCENEDKPKAAHQAKREFSAAFEVTTWQAYPMLFDSSVLVHLNRAYRKEDGDITRLATIAAMETESKRYQD